MSDKLMDFLAESGGGSVDAIVARVASRPHHIARSLVTLKERGFVKVEGPCTIDDFNDLVADVCRGNGYDTYSKDEQRRSVLREIFEHRKGLVDTIVQLSTPGYRYVLS